MGALGLAVFLPFDMLGAAINKTCEVCKQAWINLSRFNATFYQYRYVEPTAGLPKVFLYGDSISIGYTEYVRASLKGKADVMRLQKNGSSSGEFIRKMEILRKGMFQPFLKEGWSFSWDVIHFNVGLHDIKYLHNSKLDKEEGKQVSSVEVYEKNLHSIVAYLKKNYPTTKLVFATTTLVPKGDIGRFKGDAVKYNAVALKVMKNYPDIVINDLYTYSIPVHEKYAEAGVGNVHYQPEGCRLQGIEVAKVVCDVLGITPNSCPSVTTVTAKAKAYEAQFDEK
jgi:hypothetical protein